MRLLSVSEVMVRLAVKKEDTVYRLIHSRQLAAHRFTSKRGGKPRWKVSEEDLQVYLASIRQGPTLPPATTKPWKTIPATHRIDRSFVYSD